MGASTSPPADPVSKGGVIGRIAVFAVIGVVLFGVLWCTVFSAVTAALIAVGGTGVLVAGGAVSDMFESLFEMLANIILGVLAAIGAFFAAIFTVFD